MVVLKYLFLGLLRVYKLIVSPWLGNHCRFTPTCSEYAMGCFKKHGFFKAMYLTIKRLMACRPGGRSGYDPVP